MYVSESWAGSRATGVLCLAVSLVGVGCWTVPFAADLVAGERTPWLALGSVAWVVQLGLLIWVAARPRFRVGRRTLMAALVLFLIAPVMGLLTDNALVESLVFLVAYVLSVRVVAYGWPLPAVVLILAGVLVFAGVVLEDVEDGAPDATIRTFADAVYWGLGQVFRFQSLVPLSPVTSAGQVTGAIVISLSVIFAATLLTALAAWSVGERQRRQAEEDQAHMEESVERAIRAALASALGTEAVLTPAEHAVVAAPSPRDRRVWLDLDRVAGSRTGALWSDRSRAIRQLVREVDDRSEVQGWMAFVGSDADARFIGVVTRCAERGDIGQPDRGDPKAMVQLEVTGSVSDYIRAHAGEGDIVVAHGDDLGAALAQRGAILLDPADFLSLLAAPEAAPGQATP